MKEQSEVEYGDFSKFGKDENDSKKKEDRLSTLPDEIIHLVFSFLDAVSAVQTSVLSKRWKSLWTSLPVLNFHSSSFDDPLLFHSFVDHFLSLRDASTNVHVLNFTCHDELDDDDDNGHVVDSIIGYVTLTPTISTSIQILRIIAECVVGKLPQLSLCQSLTTLKLVDISTETPTTFDFVSLERFYLSNCRFECGEEEELDLFRGCVSLRCLFLHDCQYYGRFRRFRIFAPHLVDLSIQRMRVDEVFDSDCVLELFTPKLQSFGYSDSNLYDFSIEVNLSFLEKVDIAMDCLTADADFFLRLIELFEVMGSAKFVSLSFEIIEVLAMFPDLLNGRSSPFTRVQTFGVNMDRSSSSYDIPTNVMAYLFGGSSELVFVGWEGMEMVLRVKSNLIEDGFQLTSTSLPFGGLRDVLFVS